MKNNYYLNCAYVPSELEVFSDKKEKDLFLEINNGNEKIREEFIKYNLRSVIYEVNRKFAYWYLEGIVDKEELFSVGVMGLIKAVDTFNVDKNCKFITYSITCIDNEIKMFIRNAKKNYSVLSLDSSIFKENNNNSLKDKLIDKHDFVETILKKEEYELIDRIVNNLPFKKREIIRMYFGFGGKKYNQKEISDFFGFSQSYASRVIRQILKEIEIELKQIEDKQAKNIKQNKRRY